MEFHEVIENRFSVRSYKNDPVPVETVKAVVETALRAPSWGNKQSWRFVIVNKKVEKTIIGKASGQDAIGKACETAPYVVVLCADPEQSGVKNGLDYFMFDCGLAMENLVLAAQDQGLGTCIVGWFDESAVKAILNLPDNMRVIAYTPLGYSKESPKVRIRKKTEEMVYFNQWGKGE